MASACDSFNLDTALIWAAENGPIDVVALLIEKGANVNACNDDALRWAAWKGHTDVVALLIEKGANVNVLNDCALRWAARHGHKDVVALLIEKGADIDNAIEHSWGRAIRLLKEFKSSAARATTNNERRRH